MNYPWLGCAAAVALSVCLMGAPQAQAVDLKQASETAKTVISAADRAALLPDSMNGQQAAASITKEQMCSLAVRLYASLTDTAYTDLMSRDSAKRSVCPFTDTNSADVQEAWLLNLTQEETGTFAPRELANRQQLLAMLYQAVRTADSGTELSENEIAEALYLGIVHDTGVFQYSCAGPSTFRAAAELLETGIDAADLIMDTFYEKSYARMQIFGRALVESFLFMEGKCIVSYIRKKVMDFYGVKPKDLDGIVSQLRNTRGVEVAIFMYELDQNVFKVSLRSGNEVDVSKIAGYFGGGGHEKASGVTMTGTPQDILNNLAERIDEQLKG